MSSDGIEDGTVIEVIRVTGDGLDVLDQNTIFRIAKCVGLISEYIKDWFRGFAFVDLPVESKFLELPHSFIGTLVQCGLEDGFEFGGSGGRPWS